VTGASIYEWRRCLKRRGGTDAFDGDGGGVVIEDSKAERDRRILAMWRQYPAFLLWRPGITSVASLYLRNEESLLTLANDPDRAYVEVMVPAQVQLAMEHVNRDSFWYDIKILILTV